jgi:hypothetical protein
MYRSSNSNYSDDKTLVTRSQSIPLLIIDKPHDLMMNVTAMGSSQKTSVMISALSCGLPEGIYCRSKGTNIQLISADNCTIICSLTPLGSKSIVLDVCFSTPCATPLYTSLIEVYPPVVILAYTPYSGSVLGGTNVTIIGNGFINDGLNLCVFIRNHDNKNGFHPMGKYPVNIINENNAYYSVAAIPISSTRVLCISPASTPGNYTIHIYRNGVDTSITKAVYEYLPFFAFLSGTFKHIYVDMYIYIYTYVYMYIHVYMYI